MRRTKPIQRDEIRVGYNVETLPARSVRKSQDGGLEPIPELWAPVLRELQSEFEKKWVRIGISSGPCRQIEMPRPRRWRSKSFCRHCGRAFYKADRGPTQNGGVPLYCSDKCVNAVRSARFAKVRSEARAKARADRKCETCGKPIKAQRSTMRSCSIRCRVARHRKANS
jgi:hypothetical protein